MKAHHIKKISNIAEVSATYKANPNVSKSIVTSSQIASDLAREIFPVNLSHREAMLALYLNRANHTIGYTIISIGGVSQTVCDPKLIFQTALLTHASAFILIHNHPSGNTKPSQTDISLTEKVKSASILLDIQFLDHLIITENSYYSFADEGHL